MSSWHREHPELTGTDADPWMVHESYRRTLNTAGASRRCESGDPEPPAGEGTPSGSTPAGIPSRRRTGMDCDNCGAPEDMPCQHWCLSERYS